MSPISVVENKRTNYVKHARRVLRDIGIHYNDPKYWVLQVIIDSFNEGSDYWSPPLNMSHYREPFKVESADEDGELKITFLALVTNDNEEEIEVEMFTFKVGHHAIDIPLNFDSSQHGYEMPTLWNIRNNELDRVKELTLLFSVIDELTIYHEVGMSRSAVNEYTSRTSYLMTTFASVAVTLELPMASLSLLQDYRANPVSK